MDAQILDSDLSAIGIVSLVIGMTAIEIPTLAAFHSYLYVQCFDRGAIPT